MITYLTTDKNGEQASLDQQEDYKYRPGFEKKEDGSYVKMLGDKRCITDKREKAKILSKLSTQVYTMTNGEKYTLKQIKVMFKNPSSIMEERKGILKAYSTQLPITLECEHPKWIGKIEADETNGEIRYWFSQTWLKDPNVIIRDVIIKEDERTTQEQNSEANEQLVGA